MALARPPLKCLCRMNPSSPSWGPFQVPAGIVSIIYSTKVNSLYEDGKYDEAMGASRNAKTWGIVSVVIALFGWVFYVLFFGLAIFGIAALEH